MAEQGGDAVAGQGQVNIQAEVFAVNAEFGANFAAHAIFFRAGLKV